MSESSIFNRQSRTTNVLKASSVGMVCHLFSNLMGFVYRTVFIAILSASYLGINGLFWNLLAVLSLAELGIGEVIVYRFYRPIAANDLKKVGELMGFFKQVYRLVAGVVLVVGLAMLPFLDFFIKDTSAVPADVNLTVVYLLYLAQSVLSYTFVYRLSIWTADQKRYVSAFMTGLTETGKFGIQMLTLWLTRDFTLTLVSSIVTTLGLNLAFSWWTTRAYRPVFAAEAELPRDEKIRIFKDAGALMCHKLGSTVVSNSDSIVLSKFVGLVSVGLYSNYCLLTKALEMIFRQTLGGFAASFGNAALKLSRDDYHQAFYRMQFLTLFVSGWVSVMFCLLADRFVRLWIGADMVFARTVTIILSVQFYLFVSRLNVDTNISATGLFVKDKPRPLIEAAINLVVSVLLVLQYDIVGVFLGTIVSTALTVCWRAPYILYRYAFQRSVWTYWRQYAALSAFAVLFAAGGFALADRLWPDTTWTAWILEAVLYSGAYCILFAVTFLWRREFQFFWNVLRGWISRRK